MLQERLLASAIIAKTLSLQVLSERAVFCYKSWARRTGRIFTKNHNNHKSSIKNQLPDVEAPPFPPNKKKGLVHLIGTAVNVEGIPAAKVYPAVQRGVDSAKSCLFGFPMFQQVDAKKGTHSTCPRAENQWPISRFVLSNYIVNSCWKKMQKAVIPVIPQSSLERRATRP